MNTAKNDITTIDDLTNEQIQRIFSVADLMKDSVYRRLKPCDGKIMTTAFFEPSTRTRLSFQAAITRLGGEFLDFGDPRISSMTKGESILDTAKMLENYSDVIVVRHSSEGFARFFAEKVNIPVINAGDGAHEHPTQGLIALYTIIREKKSKNLTVALLGDLLYGRTTHSLAKLLPRFGLSMIFVSQPKLRMPRWVTNRINRQFGLEIPIFSRLEDIIECVDVLYVTRIQKERFSNQQEYLSLKNSYVISPQLLKKAKDDLLIMHPLPRTEELPTTIDSDPRAIYFQQAKNSVFVRMAITALVLDCYGKGKQKKKVSLATASHQSINSIELGIKCGNPLCISNQLADVRPKFLIDKEHPDVLICYYCEHENDSQSAMKPEK